MYKIVSLILCSFLLVSLFAQEDVNIKSRKGSMYIYWGWNRGFYTTSDIHFSGNDYDFELENVVAKDRQSAFRVRTYFKPSSITIPQYNFRIGYFINDKYSISLGADHMKYVMVKNQMSSINGNIANNYVSPSGVSYNGDYANQEFKIADDFLLFEHTDGLNYENVEIRRFDDFLNKKNMRFSLIEGAGIGVLIPRTNTTLMGFKRYDEFHLAGYGLGALVGVNFEFFRYFFFSSEAKFGFIHMPDIRTTEFKSDKASQHFFFSQFNGVFGVRFPLGKN